MRGLRCGSVLLGLLIAGCGTDTSARRAAEVPMDTLANGAILVRNPEAGIWRDGDGWRLVEELRIGSLAGSGPDLFGNIAAIEVDPLGRIYVAESQASEIRVFEPDGRHVRTFGRQGRGPGELERVMGLGWTAEGHLIVADAVNGYVKFDTTGTYVSTVNRPNTGVMIMMIPWPGGFGPDGEIFDIAAQLRDGAMRRSLVRYSPDLAVADTIALPEEVSAPLTATRVTGNTRSVTMAAVPFTPSLMWHLDPAGSIWSGTNDNYRLIQQNLDGDTLRIVEREYTPEPVTAADRAAARERLADFIAQGGQFDESSIPAMKPAFGRMFVDDQSYLWVRPAGGGATEDAFRADVFDDEGRYLGRVGAAMRVSDTVLVRGDTFYAMIRDDLDVQHIVRMRIDGRE